MKKIKNLFEKAKKRIKEISLKRYLNTNKLFVTYVIANLLASWLLRITTMSNMFSFRAIISDLAFITTVGSFAYLVKPRNQHRILMPLTIIMTFVCVANAIYYENYVSFASFSLLSTASFLGNMDSKVVTTLVHVKDIILIFPPFVMLIANKILKRKDYYERVEKVERSKKRFLNTICLGAALTIFTFIMMVPSDYSRLKKQWNREYLVQTFGIYVYQLNDAVKSAESKFTGIFGYDRASKTVKDFYANKTTTKQSNDYTNIFKGKNLIVIHYESMMTQNMSLSFNGVTLTPNLNRIASEGIFFSNYYPQVSVGTSSDTEFTFNTSLLPSATGTVFVNYWDRTYEAIPNILRKQGYYAASMHANNASFWNRNVMHKTLGYQKFYAKDSYKVTEGSTIGMGLSDKEFYKQSVEKIKKIDAKEKNYYLTLITLSNHTPWSDTSKFDYKVDYETTTKDANGNDVKKTLPYLEGTLLGNYYESVHYADEALGEFFNEMDQAGLLDNTVIVIYGDHDAKIAKKEYSYYYNYNLDTGEEYTSDSDKYVDVDYYKYELNRKVPLIIWTKNSKGDKKLNKEVKEVAGMYDAMPTLANMFGFDYKYGLGHDIFSTNDNIVVFPNGNWVTDDMYYNSQKDEYLLLKNSVVTEDQIKKNKEYANKILDVSNSIIVYDLEAKKNEKEK